MTDTPVTDPADLPRRRDAERTRQTLLAAAERRFARQGFAATTVRDVAQDAGVNVSLISRYFDSKAGLFEACLDNAREALSRSSGTTTSLDQAAATMAGQIIGGAADDGPPDALLLFLRSSGDPHTEGMRIAALRSFSEGLAALVGWTPDDDSGDLLLRAQLVLATAMGATLLHAAGGPDPLASASADELVEPLRDLLRALLRSPAAPVSRA